MGNTLIWDTGMMAIGVAFFVVAIAYVKGCELLSGGAPDKKLNGESGR